jgi:hypothetical protein
MELVEFWALSPAGALVAPLPDVDSWTISPVTNDAGAAELVYPVTGLNWAILHQCVTQDRRAHIQVRLDGVIHPELQITLFEAHGDDVAEGGTWSYRGWLPLGRLRAAVVKPKGGMPAQGGDSTIEQDAHYYSSTMGTIVATCMAEAQLRGALTGVTYGSFTGTHDSNGVAWSQVITLRFTPGIDYLKVIQGLVEAGLGEARMVGTDLRLYEPGTVGVDRTLTDPPLVFRRGQSLLDSPRKHTTSALATAALVVGAEGEYQWVSDAAAQTRLGQRIETSVSQGSIRDPGTLTAYAQHVLEDVVTGRMQLTHGGTTATGPVPIEDFDVGDWAWSALGSGLERLRVAQWALSMASDGTMTWQAVLNDLIAEREAAQARRLQGIEGGTTITGTSNARQIPDDLIDGVEPDEPEDVTVSSIAYTTDENVTLAAVTVEWSPVLFNTDGTAYTDQGRYSVFWRYQGVSMNPLLAWTLAAETTDTVAHFSGVRPGAWIDVRVGATDLRGNFSGWAPTVSHQTATDDDPPPVPAAAVLTPFIGSIQIEVTGLGQFGEVMPSDFRHFRVHVDTVNNFTVTDANLWDIIPGAGAVAFTPAAYGTTYFVRIVAEDTSGNRSAASAVSSAAPRQILNPDVAALSIGSAQIIDLDVGKVTAGTISSPWIIGSSIHTAASGPRFGMNSAEFFAYRADGTKTVSITNAGAASFLGEIRTAPSGARIIINPGGTAPSEMRFFPQNGSLGKYISLFTSDIPGQAPGYSLVYLKGDRYAGLPGEAVLRMWYYEASFGWFDASSDILSDEESAFYARMYSCGINSSTILHTAHGLRSAPYHEFAFEFTDVTTGMGRMKRDTNFNAFVIGCPAKGSAISFHSNHVYAVAEGNPGTHIGFTALTLTQSSGAASKTNIGDIDTDVLAILDNAPSKRWEYRSDHEPRAKPAPVRRRKRRKPGDPPGSAPGEDELVEVVLEPIRGGIHRHWGPLAENLPEGVIIPSPTDGTPLMDHGSMIGLMWQVCRELHGKIKKLERAR